MSAAHGLCTHQRPDTEEAKPGVVIVWEVPAEQTGYFKRRHPLQMHRFLTIKVDTYLHTYHCTRSISGPNVTATVTAFVHNVSEVDGWPNRS